MGLTGGLTKLQVCGIFHCGMFHRCIMEPGFSCGSFMANVFFEFPDGSIDYYTMNLKIKFT